MIVFKKKGEEKYLITNYKVMYSTLDRQESILRIDSSNFFALKILKSNFNLDKAIFYLLVRNPYKRIESFFKDKFRQAILKNEKQGEWQHCQKIFFPYLNLEESMPPDVIRTRLVTTSFNEIVSCIPDVYFLDGHLFPQNLSNNAKFYKFRFNMSIPIKYKKVFKMESENDLNELSNTFNLNLNIKKNHTNSVKETIKWTVFEKEIIEAIYQNDFNDFDYDIKC
jgi:hypothetical protein